MEKEPKRPGRSGGEKSSSEKGEKVLGEGILRRAPEKLLALFTPAGVPATTEMELAAALGGMKGKTEMMKVRTYNPENSVSLAMQNLQLKQLPKDYGPAAQLRTAMEEFWKSHAAIITQDRLVQTGEKYAAQLLRAVERETTSANKLACIRRWHAGAGSESMESGAQTTLPVDRVLRRVIPLTDHDHPEDFAIVCLTRRGADEATARWIATIDTVVRRIPKNKPVVLPTSRYAFDGITAETTVEYTLSSDPRATKRRQEMFFHIPAKQFEIGQYFGRDELPAVVLPQLRPYVDPRVAGDIQEADVSVLFFSKNHITCENDDDPSNAALTITDIGKNDLPLYIRTRPKGDSE